MIFKMLVSDIEFEKCGDIILSPKAKIFALTCSLCNDVFLRYDDFKSHIYAEHDFYLGLNCESDINCDTEDEDAETLVIAQHAKKSRETCDRKERINGVDNTLMVADLAYNENTENHEVTEKLVVNESKTQNAESATAQSCKHDEQPLVVTTSTAENCTNQAAGLGPKETSLHNGSPIKKSAVNILSIVELPKLSLPTIVPVNGAEMGLADNKDSLENCEAEAKTNQLSNMDSSAMDVDEDISFETNELVVACVETLDTAAAAQADISTQQANAQSKLCFEHQEPVDMAREVECVATKITETLHKEFAQTNKANFDEDKHQNEEKEKNAEGEMVTNAHVRNSNAHVQQSNDAVEETTKEHIKQIVDDLVTDLPLPDKPTSETNEPTENRKHMEPLIDDSKQADQESGSTQNEMNASTNIAESQKNNESFGPMLVEESLVDEDPNLTESIESGKHMRLSFDDSKEADQKDNLMQTETFAEKKTNDDSIVPMIVEESLVDEGLKATDGLQTKSETSIAHHAQIINELEKELSPVKSVTGNDVNEHHSDAEAINEQKEKNTSVPELDVSLDELENHKKGEINNSNEDMIDASHEPVEHKHNEKKIPANKLVDDEIIEARDEPVEDKQKEKEYSTHQLIDDEINAACDKPIHDQHNEIETSAEKLVNDADNWNESDNDENETRNHNEFEAIASDNEMETSAEEKDLESKENEKNNSAEGMSDGEGEDDTDEEAEDAVTNEPALLNNIATEKFEHEDCNKQECERKINEKQISAEHLPFKSDEDIYDDDAEMMETKESEEKATIEQLNEAEETDKNAKCIEIAPVEGEPMTTKDSESNETESNNPDKQTDDGSDDEPLQTTMSERNEVPSDTYKQLVDEEPATNNDNSAHRSENLADDDDEPMETNASNPNEHKATADDLIYDEQAEFNEKQTSLNEQENMKSVTSVKLNCKLAKDFEQKFVEPIIIDDDEPVETSTSEQNENELDYVAEGSSEAVESSSDIELEQESKAQQNEADESFELKNLLHDSDIEELSNVIEELSADKSFKLTDSVADDDSIKTKNVEETNKQSIQSSAEVEDNHSHDICKNEADNEMTMQSDEVGLKKQLLSDTSLTKSFTEAPKLTSDDTAEKKENANNLAENGEAEIKEDFDEDNQTAKLKSNRLSKLFLDLEIDLDEDDDDLKELEKIMMRREEENVDEKHDEEQEKPNKENKEEVENKLEENQNIKTKEEHDKNREIKNIKIKKAENETMENETKSGTNENETENKATIENKKPELEESDDEMQLKFDADETASSDLNDFQENAVSTENSARKRRLSTTKKRKLSNDEDLAAVSNTPKRQKNEHASHEIFDAVKKFSTPTTTATRVPFSPKNLPVLDKLPKCLTITRVSSQNTSSSNSGGGVSTLRKLQFVETETIELNNQQSEIKASTSASTPKPASTPRPAIATKPASTPKHSSVTSNSTTMKRRQPVVRIKRLKLDTLMAVTEASKIEERPTVHSLETSEANEETSDILNEILADMIDQEMTTEKASAVIFSKQIDSEQDLLLTHRTIDEEVDAASLLERVGLACILNKGQYQANLARQFQVILTDSSFFSRSVKDYLDGEFTCESIKQMAKKTNELLVSNGQAPIKLWEFKCLLNSLMQNMYKLLFTNLNVTQATPEFRELKSLFSFAAAGRIYLCEYCTLVFHSEKLFKAHLDTHGKSGGHTCPYCLKTVKTARGFKMHCEKCKLAQNQTKILPKLTKELV